MISRTQAGALITDISSRSLADFQTLLAARAEAAVNWIVRAIDACAGQGASAFYSRIRKPLRGWSSACPEITAHVIPTLIQYSRFSSRQELMSLAAGQARWLMSLQSLDGGLVGGTLSYQPNDAPSVFSTGQMILAMTAASDQTSDHAFLQSAANAARWLADELDESAGMWTHNADIAGEGPACAARVAWAMLELWQRTHEQRLRDKAVRVLDTVCSWQTAGGAIAHCGGRSGQAACTHAIADTIRGLLESGRVLQGEGQRYTKAAMRFALAVRQATESRSLLAGCYDDTLSPRSGRTCAAGNSQLAQVWLKLADSTGDVAFFRAALLALWPVIRRQPARLCIDRNKRGAIAGCPLCSGNMGACSPWAARLFVDAIIEAQRVIQQSARDTHEEMPAPTSARFHD